MRSISDEGRARDRKRCGPHSACRSARCQSSSQGSRTTVCLTEERHAAAGGRGDNQTERIPRARTHKRRYVGRFVSGSRLKSTIPASVTDSEDFLAKSAGD